MKIAIVGDVHGRIKQMYDSINTIKKISGVDIDLVMQVGDFHAIRDERDLNHFSVPAKYRRLGDFPLYYKQGNVPKKTIFIGGNHENYFWLSGFEKECEIIKDLFYLGRSGVGSIKGVKYAWVSGNYSPVVYSSNRKNGKPRHFTSKDLKGVLDQKEGIDILLLHDWPSIKRLEQLIVEGSVSDSEVLRRAIKRNFGSEELYELVREIRPKYVFCGHTHRFLDLEARLNGSNVRFVALNKLRNENSIGLLDTYTWEIKYFNFEGRDLFDVIPNSERRQVEIAFSYLEKDRLQEAIESFERILSGNFSDEAKSFANYGLGVAYTKRTVKNGFLSLSNIDNSISHLEESLRVLKHADAYLMLGHALRNKIFYVFTKEESTNTKDMKLIDLIERVIPTFQRAASLNEGYIPESEEAIAYLKKNKKGLERRIASRS